MRHLLSILAFLLLAGSAGAGGESVIGKLTPDVALRVLDRFAGEWVVDGKWSNGEALHARTIYEWRLGKKIMVTRTFVQDGKKEYQRYEGILAWHPQKKTQFQISFAYDGSMTESIVAPKGPDTLNLGFTPFALGQEPKVRQTLHFLDKDRFQWTVQLKMGDNWQQIIDATWKRKTP
jgi:hypothetical protein